LKRVVITSAGVISPVGDSPEALGDALREGRCGLLPIELFRTGGSEDPLGGEVKSFDARKYLGPINLRPLNRTTQLAASAARTALDAGGWAAELRNDRDVGIVLGTMFGSLLTIAEFDRRALQAGVAYASPINFSNTVINAAAGQTAILHNLRGVNTTVCVGGASGLQAVAHATDLVRGGRSDALLAGGADELCFESFYAFRRAGLLCGDGGDFPFPFDARRNGAALGEGAAILMLEDEESARERGSRALAEVKGCGSAYDPSRGHDEEMSVASIARSMRQALGDARLAPSEIDCLSASANGSPSGDRREARAVAEVFGELARALPVTAIKSMLGESLGAAGATQAVAVLSSLRDGVLPGIRNLEEFEEEFPLASARASNQTINVTHVLINSIGHDGHCCSLVLAGTRPR